MESPFSRLHLFVNGLSFPIPLSDVGEMSSLISEIDDVFIQASIDRENSRKAILDQYSKLKKSSKELFDAIYEANFIASVISSEEPLDYSVDGLFSCSPEEFYAYEAEKGNSTDYLNSLDPISLSKLRVEYEISQNSKLPAILKELEDQHSDLERKKNDLKKRFDKVWPKMREMSLWVDDNAKILEDLIKAKAA